MECHQLIDKITIRINTVYSKNLSYVGRLQVVTAVLFSLYSFWGSAFILPQSVLEEVDKKCIEYLWGSTEGKRKISPVVSGKFCCPKKSGGFNIKGSRMWNIASVGKLFCLAVSKQRRFTRVKWVHEIYMRNNNDIWSHQIPTDCSWYWKKINLLKELMQHWYQQGNYILGP